ncbi:MAG: c-type cytochrome [Cyanobacteria bacterium SZAS-4]|nr:c-type cytochrome [Cyanobacteria bacterium SZAS-4]
MLQKVSAQQVKTALVAIFAVSLCASGCSEKGAASKNVTTTAGTQSEVTAEAEIVPNAKPEEFQIASRPKSESATAKSTGPVTLTAEARGEKVFRKAYCAGCHAGGNNAMMPDKPIKGEAFTRKYKDDAILEQTIRKGFPEDGMPAFGKDQISESQMKDLILYIRSLTPIK